MNNSANILNILPNYNSNSLEGTILELKRELNEQKHVGELLKSENFQKNSAEIINFVERNEGEVDNQMERLNKIIIDLKLVVIENKKLENDRIKFGELIESPNCIRMADKLLKIKALRRDIESFLEEAGIITHVM